MWVCKYLVSKDCFFFLSLSSPPFPFLEVTAAISNRNEAATVLGPFPQHPKYNWN